MTVFSILPASNGTETTDASKSHKHKKSKKHKKHKKDKHDTTELTSVTESQSNNNDTIDLTTPNNTNTDEIDTTEIHKKNKKRKRSEKVQNTIQNITQPHSTASNTTAAPIRQTVGITPLPTRDNDTSTSTAGRGSAKYSLLYTESGLMTGRWTNTEKHILADAIQKYQTEHNLTDDTFLNLLTKRKRALVGAVKEIAAALPRRTIQSVYGYILRNYDPERVKGQWTADELNTIREMMAAGNSFTQIRNVIKRTATDIKGKWLEIKNPEYKRGNWTTVEDMKLLKLIKKVTNSTDGKPPKAGVMWSIVCEHMENRSINECRNRYYSTLYKKLMSDSITFDTDYELINNIWLSGAEDASEIRWDRMSTTLQYHAAKQRFQKLCHNVPQANLRSFDELITYLHDEFAAQYNAINNTDGNTSNESSTAQLSASDQQFLADANDAEEQEQKDAEADAADELKSDA